MKGTQQVEIILVKVIVNIKNMMRKEKYTTKIDKENFHNVM